MTDRQFMSEALVLAKKAAGESEVPVGAVVVKDGEIIGRGRNRREKEKNALAHAEIEAINEACRTLSTWRLSGCEMYVTLEPCAMCTGAIINARLSKVIFGAYDEKAGACFSAVNMLDTPIVRGDTQVIGGYMEAQCAEILSEFFSKIRNDKKA